MGDRPAAQAPPVEFDLPVHGGFAPVGFGETFPDDAPEDELEIAGEPGQDPAAAFRRTLGMFATGVTVVTTQAGDQVHGMTANAFMSVSLRPPLVVISVDRRAKMHALLHEGRRYGISVLADEQRALSDRFAGRTAEGTEEVEFDLVHETPARSRCARAPGREGGAVLLGRGPLALRGPGGVRAVRGRAAAPVPGRAVPAPARARAPCSRRCRRRSSPRSPRRGVERTFEAGGVRRSRGRPGRRALRDPRRGGSGGTERESARDVRRRASSSARSR